MKLKICKIRKIYKNKMTKIMQNQEKKKKDHTFSREGKCIKIYSIWYGNS